MKLKANSRSLTKLDLCGEENKNEWKRSERMREKERTAEYIGNEGARIISEALKSNRTLTKLGLRCNERF